MNTRVSTKVNSIIIMIMVLVFVSSCVLMAFPWNGSGISSEPQQVAVQMHEKPIVSIHMDSHMNKGGIP
jgi:flagellar basal body-associated protein FliL